MVVQRDDGAFQLGFADDAGTVCNCAVRDGRRCPEGGGMTRATGKVKFFDDSRGFGFVCPNDGSSDVFVHRADLQESCRVDGELRLSPDDLVEFDVVDAGRGPKAIAVSREGRDAPAS